MDIKERVLRDVIDTCSSLELTLST